MESNFATIFYLEYFVDAHLVSSQCASLVEAESFYLSTVYCFLRLCTYNIPITQPQQGKGVSEIKENGQGRRCGGRKKIDKLENNKKLFYVSLEEEV